MGVIYEGFVAHPAGWPTAREGAVSRHCVTAVSDASVPVRAQATRKKRKDELGDKASTDAVMNFSPPPQGESALSRPPKRPPDFRGGTSTYPPQWPFARLVPLMGRCLLTLAHMVSSLARHAHQLRPSMLTMQEVPGCLGLIGVPSGFMAVEKKADEEGLGLVLGGKTTR